jgi:hypothetical protein
VTPELLGCFIAIEVVVVDRAGDIFDAGESGEVAIVKGVEVVGLSH